MGRRRRGRAVDGWVVLDKPAGMGSTDAVALVRRAWDAKKAGHAGTLDPAATGVLAVALGEATKTVPVLAEARKAYAFRVRFGAATDTDDAEGAVIEESAARPADDAIRAALPALTGDVMQVPPQVSAVKVAGRRAYDRAREGEAMTLGARPLHVAALELVARPDADHADLRMVCGKGGYVRAIARDLGRALGTCAHVAWLRRVRSGPFDAADGVAPEAVEAAREGGTLDALLRPLEAVLAGHPRCLVTAAGAVRLRHGNPGEVTRSEAGFGEAAWACHEGRCVALGTWRAGMFHPTRVIVPADAEA